MTLETLINDLNLKEMKDGDEYDVDDEEYAHVRIEMRTSMENYRDEDVTIVRTDTDEVVYVFRDICEMCNRESERGCENVHIVDIVDINRNETLLLCDTCEQEFLSRKAEMDAEEP